MQKNPILASIPVSLQRVALDLYLMYPRRSRKIHSQEIVTEDMLGYLSISISYLSQKLSSSYDITLSPIVKTSVLTI